MHVYMGGCGCVCTMYIHTYYFICIVHMGYFVRLWGGGGTVVSVSFLYFYVLLFDDFLQ